MSAAPEATTDRQHLVVAAPLRVNGEVVVDHAEHQVAVRCLDRGVQAPADRDRAN
mgnify:CR=1 FL=1